MVEFWPHVILDVIRTAPLERWETLGKGETMKNLKSNALGLLACLAITIVALLMHSYVL